MLTVVFILLECFSFLLHLVGKRPQRAVGCGFLYFTRARKRLSVPAGRRQGNATFNCWFEYRTSVRSRSLMLCTVPLFVLPS